jgi:hypothetical protein
MVIVVAVGTGFVACSAYIMLGEKLLVAKALLVDAER